MTSVRVSRAQALAYRVAVQGLHRDGAAVGELAVLDLGLQEAMGHPAALALAARLPDSVALGPGEFAYGPDTDLALVWSLRGAPHVHRRAEVDAVAAALYPLSERDAAARLNESGPAVERAGILALAQFADAARQLRAAVTRPTEKGAVSTAASAALPKAMLRDCRACKASHLSDSAMRVGSLAAGLELEPGTAPPVLRRRPKARLPKKPDLDALTVLARAYVRLLGPATVVEFAGFVEGRRADVAHAWPDDLVEVALDGRTAYVDAAAVDDVTSAPKPDAVRLLGAFDPYLQARDRDLLVPDKAAQKVLWPVLGRPGAVLAGGEIVGAWRTKSSGRKLTITVDAFGSIPARVRRALAGEAERVAAVRGASDVALVA